MSNRYDQATSEDKSANGNKREHERNANETTPLLSTPPSSKTSSTSFNPQLGKTYPSKNSTFLQNLFFGWLTPLLELGNQRPLEVDDLYLLNPENRANQIYDDFLYYWNKNPSSIVLCLTQAFGLPFLHAGFLKLIHDSLIFVAPMVIQGVIGYLNDPSTNPKLGIYYTLAIFTSGIIQSFCLRQYFFYCFLTGMRLRSACVTAIYQKSLRLSTAARQRSSAGEITNLMSVDAQHLQDLTPYLHAIWFAVYQIVIAIYLLWQQMGPSCLAGVAVISLSMPLVSLISKIMKRLQTQLLEVKDSRMKVCYEVLSGIKVIKLQAWEESYIRKVMSFRDSELNRLKTYILAQAAFSTVSNTLPAAVGAVVFVTYVMVGHSLNVSTALTSLSLFNILRFPLMMLPNTLNTLIEANVSLQRIKKFLLEEECDAVQEGDLQDVGIVFQNADFSYHNETTALRNVSANLKSGGLYAVIGHVGSGKSTLLNGLLGDAKCVSGKVYCRGSIAFVSQQAFIQNATLRDNILFGNAFDKARYDRAIFVSALDSDLKILPGGDLTEIGEKGINLSGGQRARVSIARAVYADADIYLFDDPLAAVDGHVGRHIFDECIVKQLEGKLRLLVTNAVTYLPQCDQILVIEKGEVMQFGTYTELLKEKNGILYDVARSVSDSELCNLPDDEEFDEVQSDNEEIRSFRRSSLKRSSLRRSSKRRSSISTEPQKKTMKLMSVEDRATGDVPFSIYKLWFKAGFGSILSLFLSLYLIIRCFDVAATFWLSFWSEYATADNEVSLYLTVYVSLQILFFVGVYIKLIFLYLCGLKASRKLFEEILERILHAPMSFFDTTPLGRIVNRLSKDVTTVDEQIPYTFDSFMTCIMSTLFTLGTIIYVTPLFIIFLIPITIIYAMSQRYFIKTSRELQRLDNISRSPVHALLSETLDGMTTIRAYAVEALFIEHNNYLLDTNQRAYFLKFAINCWLALRLEFAGTMIATGATLFAVLQHGKSTLFAGLAGVSMSYAFTVTQTLNWSVRMISDLQTKMVSVERIKTYTDMDVEEDDSASFSSMVLKWRPSEGEIEFDTVDLRYRPNLPLVLKDVSFLIHPHEKIGIVGRTGSGKSSLIVSLMRLVESASGCIRIDGMDISQLPLNVLRSNISVIPQDPVLFSGTVRTNVDPFRQYSDSDIVKSLNRAHLHDKITSLDEEVSEGGANFSIGERQLICIARALLRKSKIILLDEATASIDVKTDALIQESIKTEFSECTCLTIAHRINTVMDSDRVLVMDAGHVAEFDTVDNLLKNKGIFAGLVAEWRKGASTQH